MTNATLSVKRQNHRVHPCTQERKGELLQQLLDNHTGKKVFIVTSGDTEALAALVSAEGVTLLDDAALETLDAAASCDVLISFDLPDSAVAYMKRLALAKNHALILLDPSEQKRLYPIETFLGRTILQEVVEGFEPPKPSKPKHERRPAKAQEPRGERASEERRPRREDDKRERPARREYTKDERPARREKAQGSPDKKPWDKKPQKSSRFIGKDENGKPIFSGKTGERNHRYDGTPKSDEEKAASKKPFRPGGAKGPKKEFAGKPGERNERYDKSRKQDEEKGGGKKPFRPGGAQGPKKEFAGKPGERNERYDKNRKHDEEKGGGKKPYKPAGAKGPKKEQKPYAGKGDQQRSGAKPPRKPDNGGNKGVGDTPKRPPRKINVKSFEPKSE